MSICKQLIDVAVDSGCDAVKFQKRDIDQVYTQEFLDSPRESQWGTTQREQKEGLEFNAAQYEEIDTYCKKKGIEWYASAWDLNSQDFLRQFKCKYNKVASAMIVYEDLLHKIAEEGKHTFISTGMSDYSDIKKAVDIFRSENCPFELMHTMFNDNYSECSFLDCLLTAHSSSYSSTSELSYFYLLTNIFMLLSTFIIKAYVCQITLETTSFLEPFWSQLLLSSSSSLHS